MSFCPNCGCEILDDAKFCTNCGAPVESQEEMHEEHAEQSTEHVTGEVFEDAQNTQSQNTGYQNADYQSAGYQSAGYQGAGYQSSGTQNTWSQDPQAILNMLLGKMDTAATLWLVMGIIEIVLGVLMICIIYGFVVIGIGVWSIVYSRKLKGQRVFFGNNPGEMVVYAESQKSTTIVMLIVNFLFGAMIGIVPAIYELVLEDQIENNRQILMNYPYQY